MLNIQQATVQKQVDLTQAQGVRQQINDVTEDRAMRPVQLFPLTPAQIRALRG